MGKKSEPGIRIRDEQPGSCFRELRNNFWVKILKFFDADPRSGMEKLGSGMETFGSGIRDEKNLDPGSGINIPDPQHWIIVQLIMKPLLSVQDLDPLSMVLSARPDPDPLLMYGSGSPLPYTLVGCCADYISAF
jgi:hypothetical protein